MATRTECCACPTSLPCQPMMESNEAEVDAKPEVCSATVMVMGVGQRVELEPDLHILMQEWSRNKPFVPPLENFEWSLEFPLQVFPFYFGARNTVCVCLFRFAFYLKTQIKLV
ncbi:hypothetical protein CDAR_375791 [Caerostris darwini]|uniref:Uncharacterized protein n=1 Tax=Caerostris darwini TaxID=1538125 RepID=A0AAV4S8L9_9ARAC|nr:hypothetical protein CDAR_375791 [Caerostris darwini]